MPSDDSARWDITNTVGDETAGFSTKRSGPQQLRVTGWGFWGPEVARRFEQAVVVAYRQCSLPATLVLDMSELKPMRDEGQRAFAAALRQVMLLGVQATTVITSSHLTKLQLMRIAKEVNALDKVQFD